MMSAFGQLERSLIKEKRREGVVLAKAESEGNSLQGEKAVLDAERIAQL
jgi:hypothetical protein